MEEQWIRFIDANGRGHAQPDFFLVQQENVICIEAKLTQTETALTQISQLYRPLLRHIYKRPVIGVVVCKNLRYLPRKWAISDPEEILGHTREQIYTWHWLGR